MSRQDELAQSRLETEVGTMGTRARLRADTQNQGFGAVSRWYKRRTGGSIYGDPKDQRVENVALHPRLTDKPGSSDATLLTNQAAIQLKLVKLAADVATTARFPADFSKV